MGLKYSINSAGRIVAERDIYSLGGFIPKGRLGGFIADETQLSQDGECWLSSGDISSRPDVRIKDNAYVGLFTPGINPVHTDGVTEFSGNTLIPGNISVRSFVTDTKNNVFIKDSFIGVSMDILCGPRTTTTAFPFEQGGYVPTAPRGTAFSSVVMQTGDVNICRSTDSVIRCGLNTYVYLPTGYSGRILWAYTQGETAVYSGESKVIPSGLTKIEHPVYKRFMLHITKVNGTAMTPTDLLATGAKILGHISGSVLTDIRPESVSGDYVMVNSSFIAETDNFGLNATQLRFLAGSMYDTTMYTKTDKQDYKPYGTFHNVERLEYTKYLRDSHRTAANRDTYISAYDCPLLRVDDTTYDDALAAKGDLILRNCIVPKAEFQDDVINGNTYEDIDFSYANEDLGFTIAGYARFISSHKQGIYRLPNGPTALGFVSHKGNLADTAILYQAEKYIPLDGSIMEQGAYAAGANIGVPYEETKVTSNAIVRSYKPVSTASLSLPTLPSGYVLDAIVYLDESFIIRRAVANPASIETTYQYAVMQFRRADTSRLNASDFIALNCTLRIIDHTKAPEVTGSAYVGAGCTVRGDVQLHGDPYVNRVFDVNLWERGTTQDGVLPNYPTWSDRKIPTGAGNRFRFIDTVPVEPGANITCNSGFWITCYFFDANGNYLSSPGWGRIANTAPANSAFVGIIIKKATAASDAGELIEDSDIPLANVKYVRAFKKRRYIVNELDRTSPEDILLSVDYWEQGTAGGRQADAGKIYEELKAASGTTIRLKRPINVSPTSSISSASGFSRYIRVLDAVTKFRLGESLVSAKMALLAVIIQKDPSAAIAPSEIPNSRLVLEFVPQPRIIVPYGSSNLLIKGPKIRMYDNAVLSRNLNHDADIVLQGDAVMGYDFSSGDCLCSNGHDDAIIKLP
jgi:hypothetical protein